MAESLKQSERAQQKAFSHIDDQFFQVKKTSMQNIKEAFSLFNHAMSDFEEDGFTDTKIRQALAKAEKMRDPEDMRVTFGIGAVGRNPKDTKIFSVKIETGDGKPEILTLRVGKEFTELSYAIGKSLVEILREEKGEIKHETFG
jgi:hypothetical protein